MPETIDSFLSRYRSMMFLHGIDISFIWKNLINAESSVGKNIAWVLDCNFAWEEYALLSSLASFPCSQCDSFYPTIITINKLLHTYHRRRKSASAK